MIRRLAHRFGRLRAWLADPLSGLDAAAPQRDCPGGACLPVPKNRATGEDFQ